MIWGALSLFRASKAFMPVMGLLAAVIVAAGLITVGAINNDNKRDLRDARETAETGERINEAISDGVGVSWRERLLGD